MADENGLVRTDSPDAEPMLATPDDFAAFERRFLRLIERRTSIYTMGDSTSVPKHVALDLLRSVSFVLGIDLEHAEIPERLLAVDLEDEFGRRLSEIERKVQQCGELWCEAAATMPSIPSVVLRDTMAAVGDFPKAYDFRSMAHEIPAVFDYPLCHPVPDALQGVDYINEYLKRLLVEASFLRRLDAGACIRVLESGSPDFEYLPVNLYEPIATNAIGLALIGADPRVLRITDEARVEIALRLRRLTRAERERALHVAALAACDLLDVREGSAVEYLAELAPELLPRIDVALTRGDLRGVFAG